MALKQDVVIEIYAKVEEAVKKVTTMGDSVRGLGNGFDALTQKTSNGSRDILGGMEQMGKGLSGLGDKMSLMVTGPIALLGGVAVNEAMKFESAFAGVEKTVDGTAVELGKLKQEIKDMSLAIPASTTEIAGVAEAAGQLGIKTSDISAFTETMVNLGVATNMSAEDAATSLARLAVIMDEGPDSYDRMGSAVVDLGNNYATTESEIVNMTMRLAGAGKQVGMSTPEIMGMATALTSMGIRAEAGGTALSKFMSSMQLASDRGVAGMADLEAQTGMTARELELMASNNSKDFKNLADSLGMTSEEMKGVVKNTRDLEKMAEVAGVTAEEFSQKFGEDAAGALGMFFDGLNKSNMEGISSIGILQDMGINEQRLRDAILKSGTAANLFNDAIRDGKKAWEENTALTEEAEKRYATFESQLQLLKNSLKLMAVTIGEALLPTMKTLVQWIKNITDKISAMDPQTVQAMVKVLAAMGATGPILKILGVNMGTITKAIKNLGKTKSTISEMTSLISNLGETSGKTSKNLQAILDGGMSKGEFDHIGGKISKGTKNPSQLMGPGGAGNLPMSPISPKVLASYREGYTLSDKLKISMNNMGIVGKEVANTPFFKGAVLAALAGYLVHAFTTNENFRKGLGKLGDAAKNAAKGIGDMLGPVGKFVGDMGKAVIESTNGIVALQDLAVAGAGLALVLTGFNPVLGGIALAAAGLKVAFSWLGSLGEPINQVQAMNSAFADMRIRAEQVETPLTRFSDEAIPRLQSSMEAASDSIRNTRLSPDPETLEKDMEANQAVLDGHLKTINETVAKSYDIRLQQATASRESRGEMEEASFQETKARLEQEKEETVKKITEAQEAIQGILNTAAEEKRGLNAEEVIEYNEHLKTLNEIAENVLTPQRARELAEHRELQQKKMDTSIQLTEEEVARLNELNMKAAEDTLSQAEQNYGNEINELNNALKNKSLSQEDYNTKMAEADAKFYIEKAEAFTEQAARHLNEVHGLTVAEVDEYTDNKNKLLKINNQLRTGYDENGEQITAAGRKLLNEEKKKVEEMQKNSKVTEDSLKEFNKYIDGLPKEYQKYFKNINGEINFKEGIKTLQNDLKEFEKVGNDVDYGTAQGISAEQGVVYGAVARLGEGMIAKLRETIDSHSPARKFIAIGGDTTDGLAIGIKEGAEDVYDELEDLGQGMLDQDFGLGDLSKDVTQNVLTNYDTAGQSQVGDTIAKSIARELRANPITAVVGEDDFKENVTDVLRREVM